MTSELPCFRQLSGVLSTSESQSLCGLNSNPLRSHLFSLPRLDCQMRPGFAKFAAMCPLTCSQVAKIPLANAWKVSKRSSSAIAKQVSTTSVTIFASVDDTKCLVKSTGVKSLKACLNGCLRSGPRFRLQHEQRAGVTSGSFPSARAKQKPQEDRR